jgi:hypothetical protein
VAQIGAVIGRDFSYSLLRAVAGMEDAALQTALERLADADILLVQGLPPAADYRFKHALIGTASKNNALASLTIRFSCCTLSQPFPLCFKQLQRRAAIPCDTGATMEAQGAFAASG